MKYIEMILIEGLVEYQGIESEDEDRPRGKRLKSGTRSVDWKYVIKGLIDAGATIDEIAEKSGVPKSTLQNIMTERGYSTGDKALALVDLYARNVSTMLPKVGDYFEED